MSKYQSRLNVEQLVAIDVHTHANISTRAPRDPCSVIFDEAMAKYFKSAVPPTIPEVAQYYRERKIAAVIFPVDCEAEMGHTRIANEEVAEVSAEHADVLIPFASIDPAKGRMGAREARRLIEDYGVRGFKFHPSQQGFYPNDRKAYVLYEAIAAAGLPALFHTGQTGIGAGLLIQVTSCPDRVDLAEMAYLPIDAQLWLTKQVANCRAQQVGKVQGTGNCTMKIEYDRQGHASQKEGKQRRQKV